MDKKYDGFVNQYSLSKTLRFKLIPIGKTLDNFTANKLLEQDQQRAEQYKIVKGYIDDYHRTFIDSVLNKFCFDGGDYEEYVELYYKSNKSDKEKDRFTKLEEELRKQIVKAFSQHKDFPLLFKSEIIEKILPHHAKTEEEYV